MSHPKRYRGLTFEEKCFGGLKPPFPADLVIDQEGNLVEWSDYAALAAENERLKADASDCYLLQSFIKWKGMQEEYREWLDWRSGRPSKEGGAK